VSHGFQDLAQRGGHLGQFGLDLVLGGGHAGVVAFLVGRALDPLGFGHGLGHDRRGLGLGLGPDPLPELGFQFFVMHGRAARFHLHEGGLGLAASARAQDDPAGERPEIFHGIR